MNDDEFTGGDDIVDIFGDNIADFQRIMAVIASINANALQAAA